MFCGPSRLIWFGIGSVVTYAWMRHHRDLDHGQAGGFCRPRFERRVQWEREGAPPLPPPPPGASATSPNNGEWRQTREWRPTEQGQGHGTSAGAPNTSTHVVPPGPTAQQQQQQDSLPIVTDRDYERLRQMGRSAEETISGMSEATIDSMMTGLQRLKDKLAERRGQESAFQQVNQTRATSPEEPAPRHQV